MDERTDLLVIGAGVFGLWAARAAQRAGLKVIVADAAEPGAGASGGLVGALTPHLPENWRPFKAFQLAGLLSLGARAAALAAETGIDPLHARPGRITPLSDAGAAARARKNVAAAAEAWGGHADFRVFSTLPGEFSGLIDPACCPGGIIRDTLSGKIDPRRLIAALAASVAGGGEIRRGWRAHAVDCARIRCRFDQGAISAGRILIAAGWQSLGLIPQAHLPPDGARGFGVKGQAALVGASLPPGTPLIHARGVFIVPHGEGRVAIGSTSERDWHGPGPDERLDALLGTARALCPPLGDAPVIERWAGIRPRAPGREPLAGALPGAPGILLATGGYKVGFGIAHLVGDALAGLMTGTAPETGLPPSFAPEAHGLHP